MNIILTVLKYGICSVINSTITKSDLE